MRKIPTLYVRDPDDRRYVTTLIAPGNEWFRYEEPTPTRKWDGTCVRREDDGSWWGRRELRPGATPPPGYRPVSTDPTTRKTIGWEPIGTTPFYKSAFLPMIATDASVTALPAGTYELCGPKINGNPERLSQHRLFSHAQAPVIDELIGVPDITTIRRVLLDRYDRYGMEGVVWHRNYGDPETDMTKLKARDFDR